MRRPTGQLDCGLADLKISAGTSSGQHKHSPAPQPPASEYYFYQAADGQWVFLHPLLMRILLAHFGGYEALPGSLRGRLLECELQLQTEALRKRQKYLGHLPLGGLSPTACRDEVPAVTVLKLAVVWHHQGEAAPKSWPSAAPPAPLCRMEPAMASMMPCLNACTARLWFTIVLCLLQDLIRNMDY